MPGRACALLAVLLVAGCMEQPKPNPLPRTVSLYTRMGGEERLREIVDRFAEKVGASRDVSEPVRAAFTGPDAATVKRALVEQSGALLDGPYEARGGDPFRTALQGPLGPLTTEDRKGLYAAFQAALNESNLGERLLEDLKGSALLRAIRPPAG